jgi:class 3 adenylate cyclase
VSDVDAWISAGLYDPAVPGAPERLAMLEYLTSLGVEVDTMIEYDAKGHLGRAAPDQLVRPSPTLTRDEAAAASSLTPEQVDRAWLAIGLPVPESEKAFNEGDVELLRAFAVGGELFGFDGIVQFSRVLGSSLGRVAEAAVASFLVNVEAPLLEGGGDSLARSSTSVESLQLLLALPDVFGPLFRRHVHAAIERSRATQDPGSFDRFRMAVGFLDLVGYTEWSRDLSSTALADAVNDFEGEANDRITRAGARVVKNIGDAVMFVALDSATACRLALELSAYVHTHPSLTELRGAVTTGEVVARDGDYFGPTVNRAARLVKAAEPGGVVSDRPVEGFPSEPLTSQSLRGIDGVVAIYAIG